MTNQATIPSTHMIPPTVAVSMLTAGRKLPFAGPQPQAAGAVGPSPSFSSTARARRILSGSARRRSRTRVHLSKPGYELLRPQVDGGGLVSHGARNVPHKGIAVVNRRLPKAGLGLLLAYEGDDLVILRF